MSAAPNAPLSASGAGDVGPRITGSGCPVLPIGCLRHFAVRRRRRHGRLGTSRRGAPTRGAEVYVGIVHEKLHALGIEFTPLTGVVETEELATAALGRWKWI